MEYRFKIFNNIGDLKEFRSIVEDLTIYIDKLEIEVTYYKQFIGPGRTHELFETSKGRISLIRYYDNLNNDYYFEIFFNDRIGMAIAKKVSDLTEAKFVDVINDLKSLYYETHPMDYQDKVEETEND